MNDSSIWAFERVTHVFLNFLYLSVDHLADALYLSVDHFADSIYVSVNHLADSLHLSVDHLAHSLYLSVDHLADKKERGNTNVNELLVFPLKEVSAPHVSRAGSQTYQWTVLETLPCSQNWLLRHRGRSYIYIKCSSQVLDIIGDMPQVTGSVIGHGNFKQISKLYKTCFISIIEQRASWELEITAGCNFA